MPANQLTTNPLSWLEEPRARGERAFSLLVLRDGEASTYPLSAEGRVVIGRARTADVRVDHGSVSREHAVLTLGPTFTIEDLGSANGTRVRDAALTPGVPLEVFPDDVIDLGAVLVVIQYRRLEQRLRRSCPPAYFELRVEEECERAETDRLPFTVVRVEVEGPLGAHAVQVLLAAALKPDDLVTSSATGHYELLLLGASRDEAQERIERLTKVLEQRNLTSRVRLASHPRDGRTPAELLGRKMSDGPRSSHRSFGDLIVEDEAMRRVCRLLERAADSEISILLLGETGVGKEMCAELVHRASPRSGGRLLGLNCAALSETLLESELFGHERGAFTGAVTDKLGLLESASGGTLFLDEVGDMPLATQVKLLRVFESREVLRLGSRVARPIDVRVVAATNRDLYERITEGMFREDLYYRLNGISVLVPPLRERPADIAPIARHFAARYAKKGREAPLLSRAAVAHLAAHTWPGNVRELRNVVERASILCDGDTIEPEHLPLDHAQRGPSAPAPGDLKREVKTLERDRIEKALLDAGGNQRRAAEKLGISRGALLRRIEQLGIRRPKSG